MIVETSDKGGARISGRFDERQSPRGSKSGGSKTDKIVAAVGRRRRVPKSRQHAAHATAEMRCRGNRPPQPLGRPPRAHLSALFHGVVHEVADPRGSPLRRRRLLLRQDPVPHHLLGHRRQQLQPERRRAHAPHPVSLCRSGVTSKGDQGDNCPRL